MHETPLDVNDTVRSEVIALLRARLNNAIDLASHLKQAYWSMSNPRSSKRREMLEVIHDEVDECIDMLSRRIAALSGTTDRTVRAAALENSHGPYPLRMCTGERDERTFRQVLACFSRQVHADIEHATQLSDASTMDVLSDVSRKLETQLWIADTRLS
jgi:starvation-inducible DNA-binding protein